MKFTEPTFPMHASPTIGPSILGQQELSTMPPLVSIATSEHFPNSSVYRGFTPYKDVEMDDLGKDISQSPLLVHHCQIPHAICDAALNAANTERVETPPDALKTPALVEVRDKITATLAATTSLTSRQPPTTSRLPTNACRVPSSVMSRQSAGTISTLRQTKNLQPSQNRTLEPQKRNLSQASELALIPKQLTTSELRPNAGSNLDRRKVQKISGGSTKRKTERLQSIEAQRGLIDSRRESQAQADARKRTPCSAYPRDPFEDETSFDENLSDGMLSEFPEGSSTPRSTTLTPHPHRINQDNGSPIRNSKGNPETRHYKELDRRPERGVPEIRSLTFTSITGTHRVKKHPSPSKKALEDLEAAFAIYTRLKPMDGGGDDTDELAKDNQGILSVADQNRSMSQSRSKHGAAQTSQHMSYRGGHRILHGSPYHPSLTNSHDIDGL
ncbi:hypothetical protein IF2G_00595 [Cordyceps javanica]|nr:hypothetical protein IF2G_00595 [Cordyceps javanica]